MTSTAMNNNQRPVSQKSVEMRGHNPKAMVSEEESMRLLAALNVRLGKTVVEWLNGPNTDFEHLEKQMQEEIDTVLTLMGGVMPGGRKAGFHDKELLFNRALKTAMIFHATEKRVRYETEEAQRRALVGTVGRMAEVAPSTEGDD